jgi:hypothetical protein
MAISRRFKENVLVIGFFLLSLLVLALLVAGILAR